MIIHKEHTAFQLKTFGAITMFLDHAYKICFFWIVSGLSVWLHLGEEICYNIVTLLFGVTSMSFFIFAFFCAESCGYTKHRFRYLRNLLVFAVLSEIPFQYLVDTIEGEPLKLQFGFTNVLFTLLLGTCACFAYEEMKKRGKGWIGLLAAVLCAGIAWVLHTDYDMYGVMAVFACYFFERKSRNLPPSESSFSCFMAYGFPQKISYLMGLIYICFPLISLNYFFALAQYWFSKHTME